ARSGAGGGKAGSPLKGRLPRPAASITALIRRAIARRGHLATSLAKCRRAPSMLAWPQSAKAMGIRSGRTPSHAHALFSPLPRSAPLSRTPPRRRHILVTLYLAFGGVSRRLPGLAPDTFAAATTAPMTACSRRAL